MVAQPPSLSPHDLQPLIDQVDALRRDALAWEDRHRQALEAIAPPHRDSARNLLHYLAVRHHDIRKLQRRLHGLGLSSLGRMEAYTLTTLDQVLAVLCRLADRPVPDLPSPPVDVAGGRRLLESHTDRLLGPPPANRPVRIMVTLDAKTALDYPPVRELVQAGMDVMRINCAKGDPELWQEMIHNLRRAQREVGRPCRVLCDLAGPNPRTAGMDQPLRLTEGDRLVLTTADLSGQAIISDHQSDDLSQPCLIGCTLPQVLHDAQVGERVFFDDGKLEGMIREADGRRLVVEITRAHKGSAKLKNHKGVNLPDSHLELPSLTDDDLRALDFVTGQADLVSLSFIHHPRDVEALVTQLRARGAEHLGVVLKIETRQAFEHLGGLLLAAQQWPSVGVMIARGDLGVELGFERMAEVQEEILWLCEAAHVPVIWATQVLENLAKDGLPARGEVTDAAMGVRAECVMLNKGRHVLRAVAFLDDVLGRMHHHQEKKQSMLRKLSISEL